MRNRCCEQQPRERDQRNDDERDGDLDRSLTKPTHQCDPPVRALPVLCAGTDSRATAHPLSCIDHSHAAIVVSVGQGGFHARVPGQAARAKSADPEGGTDGRTSGLRSGYVGVARISKVLRGQ